LAGGVAAVTSEKTDWFGGVLVSSSKSDDQGGRFKISLARGESIKGLVLGGELIPVEILSSLGGSGLRSAGQTVLE